MNKRLVNPNEYTSTHMNINKTQKEVILHVLSKCLLLKAESIFRTLDTHFKRIKFKKNSPNISTYRVYKFSKNILP